MSEDFNTDGTKHYNLVLEFFTPNYKQSFCDSLKDTIYTYFKGLETG
jgi:hypothetical protein